MCVMCVSLAVVQLRWWCATVPVLRAPEGSRHAWGAMSRHSAACHDGAARPLLIAALLHQPTAHSPHPTLPQVEYEDLPAIISINQAVAAGSFLYTNEKGCGDVDSAFASGECEVGGRAVQDGLQLGLLAVGFGG